MLFHTTWLYFTFLELFSQVALSSSHVPRTVRAKNRNSTRIIFCTSLKLLPKAIALNRMLFSSASTITVQLLQPSHQERCCGPAAGCSSCPLGNDVYFCCLPPACFLFSGLVVGSCLCTQVFSVVSRQVEAAANADISYEELQCKFFLAHSCLLNCLYLPLFRKTLNLTSTLRRCTGGSPAALQKRTPSSRAFGS